MVVADNGDEAGGQIQPRNRGLLPPELVDMFTPSLKVGAGAGWFQYLCSIHGLSSSQLIASLAVIGGVYGTALGIIRDIPPPLAALVGSVHWFTVGSSYWCWLTPTLNLVPAADHP